MLLILIFSSFDGSSTTTIKPINRTAPNAFDVNNPGGSVSITGFTISSSEVNESIFSFFRTGTFYFKIYDALFKIMICFCVIV